MHSKPPAARATGDGDRRDRTRAGRLFKSHALARVCVIGLAATVLWGLPARKKKEEKIVTQTLEVLPDPPAAIGAATANLEFHVSPLSAKGLLSQQVRDAIKAIWKLNKGATVVKIRALVAGTGDLRRVTSVVSETFSERRKPLPVLTVVHVGALPLTGAQVVLEAVSLNRKAVNPHGLAFLSAQGDAGATQAERASLKVAPLAARSAARTVSALAGVGLDAKDVLRLTCFTSSLEDIHEVRRVLHGDFPQAALNFAQIQRGHAEGLVECEAVARLRQAPGQDIKLVNPPGIPADPAYSQIALVGAPKLIFTSSQLAFRYQDSDVRLAFERLKSTLEESGSSMRGLAFSSFYPLSGGMAQKIRDIRFDFFDREAPPASTMLLFEGLPGLDAAFAIDVVGVPRTVGRQ